MRMQTAILAALAITTVSCAAARTARGLETEYFPTENVDFSSLKTFSWGETQISRDVAGKIGTDEEASIALKSSIEASLSAKGFVVAGDGPSDFVVTFLVTVKDKTELVLLLGNYGHDTRERTYQKGTLVVTMLEPNSDNKLWLGLVRGASFETTDDNKVLRMNKAVAKLFEGFPPEADAPPAQQ